MARTRSISSIDAEISKLEDELSKVQEKYDAQKQKQDIEARQVMEAFKRSGKSMQELMNFLDV